ncbi:hypothetical protein KUTeg_015879 [Tegillarca granosa]|uniref:Mutator-like transposase domain-containing protein n=1 Tax=Tegillarca granosa TaxID=220873 RepID=A0ABQ9EJ85_TEGGR|nr:hypothetical protein KUTeg_015879 [Tegillarca granosa]
MVSHGVCAIRYETEVKTNGLSSVLMAKCQGCHQKFKFETSPQLLNNKNKTKHYDVNVRAVWGSMATGGGLAHLYESLATLNSPGMSQQTYTTIEQEPVNNNDDDGNEIGNVMRSEADIWMETTCMEAEEESRGDTNYYCDLDSMMLRNISMLMDKIARKSTRLIGNHTTNLAESWMAIRAKFDGGKFYNRCNRGSWQSRCYGGCLRMNLGPKWSPAVWRKCTSSTAGRLFHQLYEQSKKTEESKRKRWKRKHEANKESTSKKAKREYGPDVLDSVPDILPTVLDQKKHNFLQKYVNLNPDKLKIIEKGTRQLNQSFCLAKWKKKKINIIKLWSHYQKRPVKTS